MDKRLWVVSENECGTEQLVAIAARHIKLALEYLNRRTTVDRRQAILSEVANLRIEREALLNKADCTPENKY